jgi:predicted transcriptional regulator
MGEGAMSDTSSLSVAAQSTASSAMQPTKKRSCRALFGIVKRTVYILDRHGYVVWVKRGNPSTAEVLQILHNVNDR